MASNLPTSETRMPAAAQVAPISNTPTPIAGTLTKLESQIGKFSELAVPLAVLGIVMAMIVPLPPFLLDVLISANITISVVVLLVSLHITRPVEFSVFPTALLLLTLFRLALNISSSRLIQIGRAHV